MPTQREVEAYICCSSFRALCKQVVDSKHTFYVTYESEKHTLFYVSSVHYIQCFEVALQTLIRVILDLIDEKISKSLVFIECILANSFIHIGQQGSQQFFCYYCNQSSRFIIVIQIVLLVAFHSVTCLLNGDQSRKASGIFYTRACIRTKFFEREKKQKYKCCGFSFSPHSVSSLINVISSLICLKSQLSLQQLLRVLCAHVDWKRVIHAT